MDSATATLSHFHFCTYFDRNYLARGLVLYESLVRHCARPFTLWVLCFDEETYDSLVSLEADEIRLISLETFEAGDSALLAAKTTRSTVEYYWTCTPSLPLFVLRQDPSIEVITYLDADQCLYADPAPIYDELGHDSILIIEHRYPVELAYLAKSSGIFNVGLMAFRRDDNGLACLNWWRARCIEWCYRRHEDGKFGDQKYLDDWPKRFHGVVVLRHAGGCVAPWNLSQYVFETRGSTLTVDGYPVIVYHFHGFRAASPRISEPADIIFRIRAEHIVHLYIPYADALRANEGTLANTQPTDAGPGSLGDRFSLGIGLISQRYFLDGPVVLSRILWRVGAIWGRDNWIRVHHGFRLYAAGESSAARRCFLAAIVRNPLLLRNLKMMTILVEPALGSTTVDRLRAWRHRHST